MSETTTIIEAKELKKIFGRGNNSVQAVKEAVLTVTKGERVYINGPSGAGKSTLLDMMGGLSKPTAGEIFFGGKDIYKVSDRARSFIRNRSFGFVFQFYHLLPELNVMENVMFPARIKRGGSLRKIREKAAYLLDKMRMGHRLTHRSGQLSGGEVQRTAIARALINSPDILFCDEPTGNLNTEMSEEIYELLHKVSNVEEMAVVVVSHQGVPGNFFNSKYTMKDGILVKTTTEAV